MELGNFDTHRLRGKKVAVLAADGFEYVELVAPVTALRASGAEVQIVSLHAGRIRGMNLTEPTRTVAVDRLLDLADPEDYDALLIPGGFIGPDFLRQSRDARLFVQSFDRARKPIATLCHGPWVLISAGLVDGRRLAAWPGIRDDVAHAGGVWRDAPVVTDRNWVTSRSPADLPSFVPAMIELFAEGAVVGQPELGAMPASEGESSSPAPEMPPEVALVAARWLPGPTLRTVAAAATITAAGAFAVTRALRA